MKKVKNDWEHIQRSKGLRSGLEEAVNSQLIKNGIDGEYEHHIIEYVIPESKHTYKPDFRLPNGIFIETKGRFLKEDRKKHLLIKEQHPHLDIRFVFTYPNGKLYKGSKTTYAQWCDKYGFKWSKGTIPEEWLNEQAKQSFF